MLAVVCTRTGAGRRKRSAQETDGAIGRSHYTHILSPKWFRLQIFLHWLNVTFSQLFLDEFYTTIYRPYEDIDYNMPTTYEDGLSPSEVLLDRIFGESLQVCSILTMTYIYEITIKLIITIEMKWNSTSINITFSGIARTGVKVETKEAQN